MGQIGLCIMQTHSAPKGSEMKPKGRDNFLCLTFFGLGIKYEFYCTLSNIYEVF